MTVDTERSSRWSCRRRPWLLDSAMRAATASRLAASAILLTGVILRSRRTAVATAVRLVMMPAEECDEGQQWRGEHQCGGFGSGEGEVLGHHFPGQPVERRHHCESDDQRDRMNQVFGRACGLERPRQEFGDDGFAKGAESQRCHGDAELAGGDHQRQLLDGP
jgi:hypothetical protein